MQISSQWARGQWGGIPWVGAAPVPSNSIVGLFGIPSEEAFGVCGVGEGVGVINLTGANGIPSAEAFGTGGIIGIALVGSYGIPSEEAFGHGAILAERPINVFIGGVDVMALVKVNTLNITTQTSGQSSGGITLLDPTGVYRAIQGQEFLVYRGGVRIYGGYVNENLDYNKHAQPDMYTDLKLVDWSYMLTRRVVGKYYTQSTGGILQITVADIVDTILAQDGFSYDTRDGDPGVNLGIQMYNYITVQDVFDQLMTKTNWQFRIDPYKVIRWFPQATSLGAAPFNIADEDGNTLKETMQIRHYLTTYANRVGVRPSSTLLNTWDDTYSGTNPGPIQSSPQKTDGIRRFFVALYPFSAAPTVTVNGVAQVVIPLSALHSTPSGSWQWYWVDPDGQGIQQNAANPALGAGDTLVISYPSPVPLIIWAQNDAQIAARKAIEGGSGIYETVIDAPDITSYESAILLATSTLAMLSSTGVPVDALYSTNRDGLQIGQSQSIVSVNPLVDSSSGQFVISQIIMKDVDKQHLQYAITATNSSYKANYARFFRQLVARTKTRSPQSYEIHTWQLAPSYPGITNPGVIQQILPQRYVIQATSATLQYFEVYFEEAPQTTSVEVHFLINGNGWGGALGAPLFFHPGDTAPQRLYVPPTSSLPGNLLQHGDVIQVWLTAVGTAPFPGRDGIVTMVAAVN